MTLDSQLVGVAAFLQTCVINFPAPVKHPVQFFGCVLVRVDSIFESFDAHERSFERRRLAAHPSFLSRSSKLFFIVLAASGSITTRSRRSSRSCGLSAMIGPLIIPQQPRMSNGSLNAMRSKR